MRKKAWLVGLILVSALTLVALVLYSRPRAKGGRSEGVPEGLVPPADSKALVGEWDRVDFPEAVIPVNWRKFSESGETSVRYGDVIIAGTYRFIDPETLEIQDRHDGKTHRWTVGIAPDSRLVMVHRAYGWIEKYQKVPPGTLEP